MTQLFSVPVFLVVFRETLETVIIISVLLAFLKQTLGGPQADRIIYKRLVKQVWLGTGLGLAVCFIVAAVLIAVFYTVGSDTWKLGEFNYDGAFSLVASIIITVVGAGLLRIGRMQDKWRAKLAASLDAPVKGGEGLLRWLGRLFDKYVMFALPFVTVLREGIEAIIFVAGVSFSAPATAVPIPAIVGFLVGNLVGYIIYKSGSTAKMQISLICSTCIFYLVAAGLFSRAIWFFEMQKWNNLVGGEAELGSGPGSYDIDKSVWHVNCCNPLANDSGGWGIFNAILGWTNSATYGSVISYNIYWLVVIAAFFAMRYNEVHGYWPLMKPKHHQRSLQDPVGLGANTDKGSPAQTDSVIIKG